MMIDTMEKAYSLAGGHSAAFHNSKIGSLVINEDKIISANTIEGAEIETDARNGRVWVKMRIKAGYKFENPFHLCFGVLSREMAQKINIDIVTEEDSRITLNAYCTFPNAVDVLHDMDARIVIGANSRYSYNEVHYHGDEGLVRVLPKAKIILEPGAQLVNKFSLVQGAVGILNFDYDIECRRDAVCHMLAKVYGKFNDDIKIKERAWLVGDNSHAVLETRMVIKDNAKTEIINEIVGEGAGSRGHMDCTEIIAGAHAQAKAIPIAIVKNDKAKVTHEAAIGSIDHDQLNLLMSRGLTPEQATEVIINGLLK